MNPTTTLPARPWGLLKKFLFRFFFVFCAVTIVPVLSGLAWPQLIEWSGDYFFNEKVAYHPSGSGDTLYDFYDFALKAIVSLIVSVIWSILDKKRKSYTILLYWQEVYIRYYLAFFLLVYGLMKIIKLQFAQPGLSALLIPLGNKSPMGLAWTFIGYSDAYTIFSGACEAVAACFLIYRKTRTLGALISFGVMLNVFLMNMSYDIPVKLFSLQLTLLSLFLIGLDHKRLIGAFVLNRPVEAQQSLPPFKDRRANIVTQIIKCAAVAAGLGFTVYNNLESKAEYGDAAPKPPMYGIYEAEEFILNNDTIAPVLTDTVRWRYLVLDRGSAQIFNMKTSEYDNLQFFRSETDTVKRQIEFFTYSDSIMKGRLRYEKIDGDHYMFSGSFNNDSIRLRTVRTDEEDYPLMSRKFSWVNEYPYNR